MQKIVIVSLLSLFAATPAWADNTGKPYVAADLGSATYSNLSPFPNPGVFRIAGGYHLSPAMAVELGYSKFGDSTVNGPSGSATISAHSFQIALVGSVPLSAEFDLIGKVGLAANKADGSNTALSTVSTSQNSPMYGVGAQFHINQQVSIRAQYDNYGKFESGSPAMAAHAVYAGLAYDF